MLRNSALPTNGENNYVSHGDTKRASVSQSILRDSLRVLLQWIFYKNRGMSALVWRFDLIYSGFKGKSAVIFSHNWASWSHRHYNTGFVCPSCIIVYVGITISNRTSTRYPADWVRVTVLMYLHHQAGLEKQSHKYRLDPIVIQPEAALQFSALLHYQTKHELVYQRQQ